MDFRETCSEVVNALSCLHAQYRDFPLGFIKVGNLLNISIVSKSSKNLYMKELVTYVKSQVSKTLKTESICSSEKLLPTK
jgi:hypothetical protein